MSGFDNPDGPGGSCDRHTKSEHEPTTHHLALRCIGGCKSLNDGADNDQQASNEHANATAPSIDGRSNKWESGDTTNLVHGTDNTSPDAFVLSMEVLQEILLVVQETTQKHGIVAVHGLAEEADQENSKQCQGTRMSQVEWLLDQSLIVGFTTLDFLDRDNLK